MKTMPNNMDGQKGKMNRASWTTDFEATLIDLWQENIAGLRGARKNVHIYKEMAEKLSLAGLDVCGKDIKCKLDNLTKKYREEKKSGGTSSAWVHYIKVHEILGCYKPFNLASAMVESTDLSMLSDSCEDTYEDVQFLEDVSVGDFSFGETSAAEEISTDRPRKRKSASQKEDTKKRMLEMAERRTKAITEMVEDNRQFHKDILTLLKSHIAK